MLLLITDVAIDILKRPGSNVASEAAELLKYTSFSNVSQEKSTMLRMCVSNYTVANNEISSETRLLATHL